jgi:hypothetical protein
LWCGNERGDKVLVLSHPLSQKGKEEVRWRSEKGRDNWTSGRTKRAGAINNFKELN